MTETKKIETPKIDIPKMDTSPFASFDPMAYWNATQAAWQKAMTDAYGRAQAFADQYAVLENQFLTRAQGAVANWAQLTQDAISYAGQLAVEARKLGFDTARKMGVLA